jgi:hypothetical protein
MVTLGVRIVSAFNLPDAPPIDRRRITILLVAGDDAALASNAFRHIEVKAILLATFEGTRGDERRQSGFDLDRDQTARGRDNANQLASEQWKLKRPAVILGHIHFARLRHNGSLVSAGSVP